MLIDNKKKTEDYWEKKLPIFDGSAYANIFNAKASSSDSVLDPAGVKA